MNVFYQKKIFWIQPQLRRLGWLLHILSMRRSQSFLQDKSTLFSPKLLPWNPFTLIKVAFFHLSIFKVFRIDLDGRLLAKMCEVGVCAYLVCAAATFAHS